MEHHKMCEICSFYIHFTGFTRSSGVSIVHFEQVNDTGWSNFDNFDSSMKNVLKSFLFTAFLKTRTFRVAM